MLNDIHANTHQYKYNDMKNSASSLMEFGGFKEETRGDIN